MARSLYDKLDAVKNSRRMLDCVAVNCPMFATKGTLSVPLCARHDEELSSHHRLAVEVERGERDARIKHEEMERHEEVCTVYYLQRADRMVKIGYTADLDVRRFELEQEHGPLRLLATEKGGRLKEKQRHQEYAALRQGRSEWFVVDDDLAAHIDRCSRAHAERT